MRSFGPCFTHSSFNLPPIVPHASHPHVLGVHQVFLAKWREKKGMKGTQAGLQGISECSSSRNHRGNCKPPGEGNSDPHWPQ